MCVDVSLAYLSRLQTPPVLLYHLPKNHPSMPENRHARVALGDLLVLLDVLAELAAVLQLSCGGRRSVELVHDSEPLLQSTCCPCLTRWRMSAILVGYHDGLLAGVVTRRTHETWWTFPRFIAYVGG